MNKLWFVLGIIMLIGLVPGTALLTKERSIDAIGEFKGVDISFWTDASATVPVTSVDWGLVYVGDIVTRTVYVRSDSNVIGDLAMITANYNPTSVQSAVSVTWDREGYSIVPGSIVPAIWSLEVLSIPSGVTTFSFDINVTIAESP
jgi:hypothetical protein